MGSGQFYSRNNAFKLVILVDLLVHVLASCNGRHNRFNFDIDDEIINLERSPIQIF
ncbi:hypothetical protein [Clostridium tagluense]|uniref:hypothetical protein n=1 Tax=Clostridium tagluense TaxID=360422 RepID=UPI001CF478BF|nr:hypothetical protein [Clostridium tagluense]MCB2301082.1 hypothetical protein [Clostridium tagluense]